MAPQNDQRTPRNVQKKMRKTRLWENIIETLREHWFRLVAELDNLVKSHEAPNVVPLWYPPPPTYRRGKGVGGEGHAHCKSACFAVVIKLNNTRRRTVASLFKTLYLMKKRLLGLNLNQTCKQLTHSPPCDFHSVWCAVLLVAKQEVYRKKNWAAWNLQNPFSTIKSLFMKSLFKAFYGSCKYADFLTRSARMRAHCAQITLTEMNTPCMYLVHTSP